MIKASSNNELMCILHRQRPSKPYVHVNADSKLAKAVKSCTSFLDPHHIYIILCLDTVTISSASIDKSILVVLPSELKNDIWRRALHGLDECPEVMACYEATAGQTDLDLGTSIIKVEDDSFREPSLLTSCKQIRQEAGSIFYSEHSFSILPDNLNPSCLERGEAKRDAVIKAFNVAICHDAVHCMASWSN